MSRSRNWGMIRTSHRKVGIAAFLTLLFALLPFAAAGPAQAFMNPVVAYGQVNNADSPRCLDSGTTKGALLFNCSGSPYQYWVYVRTGQITGSAPTGCLDDGTGLNGSRAVLATCTGSTSQQWTDISGVITNVASGKCLNADLGTIGEQATIVDVLTCNGGLNQIWTFQYNNS
jgi:hypothetical protein